jgi:hypothetical protein
MHVTNIVSLALSFLWRGFRFSHGQRETKKMNNNNNKKEEIRRMSKVLHGSNNLPDMFRVFEKEWLLSKNTEN